MYDLAYHRRTQEVAENFAPSLVKYLLSRFSISFVSDFGCGTGVYVKEFQKNRVQAVGFDFSKDAVNNACCPGIVCADLSTVGATNNPKSSLHFGLCLEVVEHIGDEYWKVCLENISCNIDLLLFSAAKPGQDGTGHINCHPVSEWIERLQSIGWKTDLNETEKVRQLIGPAWFKNSAILKSRKSQGTSDCLLQRSVPPY